MRVTLLERDEARARYVAERLPRVTVLHDEGVSRESLEAAGVEGADAFVSCAGDDRANLLAALNAKRLGAGLCVSVVSREEFTPLVDALEIDASYSPRLITAEAILRFVHTRTVRAIHLLRTGFEVLELEAQRDAPIVGRAVGDTKGLLKGWRVGAVLRGDAGHRAARGRRDPDRGPGADARPRGRADRHRGGVRARRMSGLRLGPGAALVGLTLGGTLIACGAGMLVCAAVGIADGEAALALGLPGLASVALGAAIMSAASAPPRGLSVRPVAGMLAVTLAWLSASAIGAVPLLAAGTFSSPLDAFFEGASGFTTTGATLIRDVGAQPSAVLLWRSVMQWLGGVGIVVLVVAIAPVTGPGVQRAFYAETSGVTAERLTPRIIDTAKIIATIYTGLSAAAVLAYAIAGMSLLDAVNHSMTTISTGGFSTRTDSIGAFHSLPIELVAIVFMILSGINFAFYWRAVRGKPVMPQAAEVLAFLAILVAAIAAVALSLWLADDVSGGATSIRDAAFSVTSVITTTGFVTVDFDTWNSFARIGDPGPHVDRGLRRVHRGRHQGHPGRPAGKGRAPGARPPAPSDRRQGAALRRPRL